MRLLTTLCLLLVVSCTARPAVETGFLNRKVTVGGREFPYVVYLPAGWERRSRWPVILFLHGAGERGSDGLRQTTVGLGPAIRSAPQRVPAIVVFPQVPPDERWLGASADAAMLALERSIADFHGDRRRVYLTGLSMGGYGTWHLAMAQPDRFAALVPIAGGVVPAGSATSVRQSPLTLGFDDPHGAVARAVRQIPTWIVHGSDDTVVLPTESRKMVEALTHLGADVHYHELSGVGHNSWDPAYADDELWKWLFAQRR